MGQRKRRKISTHAEQLLGQQERKRKLKQVALLLLLLLNAAGMREQEWRRRREVIAARRNRKLIGGPEVGGSEFVVGCGGGLWGGGVAVGASVSAEVAELGVGAVAAVTGVRSAGHGVNVSVLLQSA